MNKPATHGCHTSSAYKWCKEQAQSGMSWMGDVQTAAPWHNVMLRLSTV